MNAKTRLVITALYIPLGAFADSLPSQTTTTAVGSKKAMDVNVVQTVGVGSVEASQGAAAAISAAWPMYLTDLTWLLGTPEHPVRTDTTGTTTQPVSGSVTVSGTVTANAGTGTLAVSGPLTDAQLRASAVPVSGTFYQATQPVSGTVAVSGTVPVSGTFYQATQPISGTVTANAGSGTLAVSGPATDAQLRATPLPVSGTFYQATQPVSGTFWQATQPVSGTVTANAGTGTMAVSGTFWQATQPVSGTVTANAGSGTLAVSAASLPLPSGASTSAKQPALGSAGTASADVITVQGIASMTALKVDGSGVTQPVSGTFWQATQPVSGTVTANQGGTWTVQPGNTANSTPWLTTDSATSATASVVPAKASYVGADVLALGAAPTALSAGNLGGLAVDTQNRLLVNSFHPNLIVCNLLTTATSSTSLAGSCAAPGASKSVYLTDISIGGGVATSATAPAIIQTGTGGTCGSSISILYRCNHGATAGCEAHFSTPIKATANAEVCILDGVTGTKSVTVQGFIAP